MREIPDCADPDLGRPFEFCINRCKKLADRTHLFGRRRERIDGVELVTERFAKLGRDVTRSGSFAALAIIHGPSKTRGMPLRTGLNQASSSTHYGNTASASAGFGVVIDRTVVEHSVDHHLEEPRWVDLRRDTGGDGDVAGGAVAVLGDDQVGLVGRVDSFS